MPIPDFKDKLVVAYIAGNRFVMKLDKTGNIIKADDFYLNNIGSGIAQGTLKPDSLKIENLEFIFIKPAPDSSIAKLEKRVAKGFFEYSAPNENSEQTEPQLKLIGKWINPDSGQIWQIEQPKQNSATNQSFFAISTEEYAAIKAHKLDAEFKSKIAKGIAIGSLDGVIGYFNGEVVAKSWGDNHNGSGSYLGLKWQCVEYIRRYYDQVFNMYLGFRGDAKAWAIASVADGAVGKHGLQQFNYVNGFSVAPQKGDIIVFANGEFGHVAIIGRVTTSSIEIAQQNIVARGFKEIIKMTQKNSKWELKKTPRAILRKPQQDDS
jgi:surface antigen